MDGLNMELFESNTHSFIIKIWLEETAEQAGHATWRGHVTHVPSGERRYVKDLSEIVAFVAPYVIKMGAKVDGYRPLGRWMGQWKKLLMGRR